MTILIMAGEILPVIGTIGLLGLWLYQQKEIEKNTKTLGKINSARSVYQTYQSNNALFNAINSLEGAKGSEAGKIYGYQLYNYELGLRDIETVLTEAEKRDLPPCNINQPDIINDPQKAFELTQERLTILQDRLNKKEKSIQAASKKSKNRYFWAYIFLSIISISGAVLKVVGKME